MAPTVMNSKEKPIRINIKTPLKKLFGDTVTLGRFINKIFFTIFKTGFFKTNIARFEMAERLKLPYTKAGSAEERLEELVKNDSLLKCVFVSGGGFYADMDHSEFRKYPDGFEIITINSSYTATTKGLLYWETKSICFLYNLGNEHKIQDVQRGE